MDKQCTTNDSSQLLRVINESGIEKYKDCISNTDWTALNMYENCETYYKHFIDVFKNIYDHGMYFQSSKSRNDIETDSHGSLHA